MAAVTAICWTSFHGRLILSVQNANMKSMPKTKRKILVILSNRVNLSQVPRFVDVLADDKGTILEEKVLRRRPRAADYDEVWENDEGRTELSSCTRFKHKYNHPLQKKK
jgi:hypothetical protein